MERTRAASAASAIPEAPAASAAANTLAPTAGDAKRNVSAALLKDLRAGKLSELAAQMEQEAAVVVEASSTGMGSCPVATLVTAEADETEEPPEHPLLLPAPPSDSSQAFPLPLPAALPGLGGALLPSVPEASSAVPAQPKMAFLRPRAYNKDRNDDAALCDLMERTRAASAASAIPEAPAASAAANTLAPTAGDAKRNVSAALLKDLRAGKLSDLAAQMEPEAAVVVEASSTGMGSCPVA